MQYSPPNQFFSIGNNHTKYHCIEKSLASLTVTLCYLQDLTLCVSRFKPFSWQDDKVRNYRLFFFLCFFFFLLIDIVNINKIGLENRLILVMEYTCNLNYNNYFIPFAPCLHKNICGNPHKLNTQQHGYKSV